MYTLVCAQSGETNINHVCDILKSNGAKPLLFERYRRDHFVTYTYTDNKIEGLLKIEGTAYPLRSDVFPAVWFRIKPVIASEIPGEKSNINEKFCTHEWKHVLTTLDIFLEDSKWINKIGVSQKYSCKAQQLKLALECGLTIPNTMITNNSRDVFNLFSTGKVIYKTLSSFFTAKEAIFTNLISPSIVMDNQESIAMAPGIFQNMVEKDHELRVTVVGEKIFTVKINSQKNKKTSIDWRLHPYEEMYEESILSNDTTKKLLAFHSKADLVYASYDFIVDKHGNEVFLECNPSGQWLWLEQFSKSSVAEAIALELKGTYNA